jgi:tripartite-type tricarboxylate transporter receptor subunit TctC
MSLFKSASHYSDQPGYLTLPGAGSDGAASRAAKRHAARCGLTNLKGKSAGSANLIRKLHRRLRHRVQPITTTTEERMTPTNHPSRRRSVSALLVAALAVAANLFALPVSAQDFPNKPIKLVIPYPPGGATDVIGRIVALKLSEALGQQVVVDNRAGAAGSIGAAAVATAPADGYTLLMGALTSHSINAALQPNLPFDLVKDFVPVGVVGQVPLVFVVNPKVPVKTLKELMAYAKANPGVSFASSGNGSPQHMAGELFKSMTKLDMLHVPYKGSGPAMNDLIGGQVQSMIETMPAALPHIKAGSLRPLAIAMPTRSANLPDVPTAAEAGLPDFIVTSLFGVLTPAKTPPALVAKLTAALEKVLALPDTHTRMEAQGVITGYLNPPDSAKRIKAEMDKWTRVAKEANIKLE